MPDYTLSQTGRNWKTDVNSRKIIEERCVDCLLQFMSVIRTVTDGDIEIIKLLQKKFNKATPQYKESFDFHDLLDSTSEKVGKDTSCNFV